MFLLDDILGAGQGIAPQGWSADLGVACLVFARMVGVVFCLGTTLFRLEWRLRLGLAVLLSAVVVGRLPPESGRGLFAGGLALSLLTEAALGAAVGLGATIVLWGVRLAAELLAQFLGGAGDHKAGTFAGDLPGGGFAGSGQRPVDLLLNCVTMLVFLQSQGHVRLVLVCERSFRLWPPGEGLNLSGQSDWLAGLLQQATTVGLNLAWPMLAGCGLASLGVALIVRWLPNLDRLPVLPICRLAICWLIFSCGIFGLARRIEMYSLAASVPADDVTTSGSQIAKPGAQP